MTIMLPLSTILAQVNQYYSLYLKVSIRWTDRAPAVSFRLPKERQSWSLTPSTSRSAAASVLSPTRTIHPTGFQHTTAHTTT